MRLRQLLQKLCLKLPAVASINSKMIYWSLPWPDWLKVNFDGAKNVNGQGIGFMVRDSIGQPIIAGRKRLIKLCTINHIELCFPWRSLTILQHHCNGKLIIQGDSRLQENFISDVLCLES